jgi:hypothetical protein
MYVLTPKHYSTLSLEKPMLVIQVDIDGYPPIPAATKQSSDNLLFLAGFRFLNLWGHFEGLNEVFSGSRTSMLAKGFN